MDFKFAKHCRILWKKQQYSCEEPGNRAEAKQNITEMPAFNLLHIETKQCNE